MGYGKTDFKSQVPTARGQAKGSYQMTFPEFIQWAFLGIISAGITAGVILLWDLNTKIAVIIEKVTSHERRIVKLEEKP